MAQGRPVKLADLMTELMARRGFARQQAGLALDEAWRQSAGALLAQRSRVGAIKQGVLDVVVSSSSLVQAIAFERSALLARLQAALPDEHLVDLRVRVGRVD
ncbi:MAG: DciA family protein [Pirellulales bacterium]